MTDLWPDIEQHELRSSTEDEPTPARRFAIAAFALMIAAVTIGFAIRAFQRPSAPVVPNLSPPVSANGDLYFAVGGGEVGVAYEAVSPDGTNRRTIFSVDPAHVGWPQLGELSWSPDGSRIAFVSRLEGHVGIFTATSDGSNIVRLDPDATASWPSWSPDGGQIAFSSARSDASLDSCPPGDFLGGDVPCPSDIYVMNADGSSVQRITDDPNPEFGPVWSPDGSQIAFTRQGERTDLSTNIAVMNADGSGLREVASTPDGSDFRPSWSPAGTSLVFASIRNEDWGIYVTDLATGLERGVVTTDPSSVDDPAWSPDGTQIAYVSGGVDLTIANADGSAPYVVASDPDGGGIDDIAWRALRADVPVLSSVALPGGLFPMRLAIGEGTVWVLASKDEQVSSMVLVRVDPQTDQVVATIPLEGEPWYLAFAGEAVWVGSPRSSELQRVDVDTNQVTAQVQLPGDGVSAIAAHDDDVWVEVVQDRSDQGQPDLVSLVRIDARTNEVVATIPLEGLSGYDDEVAIGEGAVWVAGVNLTGPSEERGADLVRIDPSINTIEAVIPVPAFSVRAGAGAVWVTSPADGVNDSLREPESWVAREIDPITDGVSAPIDLPGATTAVLAVTDGGVWFSGYDKDGSIHPVRLRAGAFDPSMPPIHSIYSDMIFDEASGTIWVAAVTGLDRIDIP